VFKVKVSRFYVQVFAALLLSLMVACVPTSRSLYLPSVPNPNLAHQDDSHICSTALYRRYDGTVSWDEYYSAYAIEAKRRGFTARECADLVDGDGPEITSPNTGFPRLSDKELCLASTLSDQDGFGIWDPSVTSTGLEIEVKKRKLSLVSCASLTGRKPRSLPDKPVVVQVGHQTHSQDVAVIIGNSIYSNQGRDIPNVMPAHADAESIKDWLVQTKGIREGNIIHLQDATGSQMVSVFGNDRSHKGQLFNWTKPNISNVYVYYAGHGAPAGDNSSAFLVPTDSNSATIELTGYPLATLYKNLNKLPAKSITVILESCFSGTSQNGNIISRASGILIAPKVPTAPKNITVISAGRANQIASWEQDDSHSLFTKYFLKGMSGEADVAPYGDGDGEVKYDELGKYLEGTMTYYARRYYGRDQNAQIVQSVQ
jgi:hypothetical protein